MKPTTLPKVPLLHGCYAHILNFCKWNQIAQSASYYLESFRTLVSFIIFYAHLNNYIEKDTFSLSNKTVYLVKNYLLSICHKKKQYCTSFFTDYEVQHPEFLGEASIKRRRWNEFCLFVYSPIVKGLIWNILDPGCLS